MNIVGKVIKILDARAGVSQRTGNEWYIREFVIETEDQYPVKLCIQVSGKDKWEQWNVQVGNKYDVAYNISSREWKEKWFTSVEAWKVTLVSESNKNNGNHNAKEEQITSTTNASTGDTQPTYNAEQANGNEDLPF